VDNIGGLLSGYFASGFHGLQRSGGSFGIPISGLKLKVRNESANDAYDNQSSGKDDNSPASCCLGVLGVRLPRLSIKKQLFIVLFFAVLFGSLTCFCLFRSFDASTGGNAQNRRSRGSRRGGLFCYP
jgi:hypothetical protein